MKNILILLCVFFSFSAFTEEVVDRLGVKGPLEFNNTKFNLAAAHQASDDYYIQEYLPEKETFDSFKQLLTIHLFKTNLTVDVAAKLKVKELVERKKSDPVCNYEVSMSPDGKESMVDFLLSESKDNQMTVVEFNVYRYKQVDLGNSEKGLLVYAYSKRSYGMETKFFLENLKSERTVHLNHMISASIPNVKINK